MTDDLRVLGLDVHVSVHRCDSPAGATPLLMLMGIGGNSGMWQPFRRLVGRNRTTIAFDVPGTGRSSTPALPLPMPVLGMIASRVLDHAGVERADVLGVSWGGVLAQQLVLCRPCRVRRAVLASTNVGLGSVPSAPAALRTLVSTRRFRDPDSFAKALAHFGGGGEPENLQEHVAARFAYPPTWHGYLYQALSISTWSSLPFLPLMRLPTLLLAGDDDRAVPAVNARIMARLIPGAELAIVPGGGHLMLFEQARELATVVTGFLDRPEASRRSTSVVC